MCVEGSSICRLQPLVHWEFMGLRTLRFRNYDDDTQKSPARAVNASDAKLVTASHARQSLEFSVWGGLPEGCIGDSLANDIASIRGRRSTVGRRIQSHPPGCTSLSQAVRRFDGTARKPSRALHKNRKWQKLHKLRERSPQHGTFGHHCWRNERLHWLARPPQKGIRTCIQFDCIGQLRAPLRLGQASFPITTLKRSRLCRAPSESSS